MYALYPYIEESTSYLGISPIIVIFLIGLILISPLIFEEDKNPFYILLKKIKK